MTCVFAKYVKTIEIPVLGRAQRRRKPWNPGTINPDLARVGYDSAFFVKPSRFCPGGFIKREFWQVQQ